ncbi:fumarate reductase/succinate dehydrogenase flavoprotein subunit [Micromonospora sp. HM5-17]|jgi:succinate dehydrogenase / fumarate reductase flavoprotein subunit|uniref:fumarate reductase/succinate dehydrogenase flavoprotein subunit n=1 Tax=Micromonospora sp. HM5-17 TaxID=2487710 RepID=UPI001F48AFC1|nr:fumarate reductase/succinate dehydrogenase flavoprotein subunit [Micromonospora sp. HM5-17]
MTSRADEPTNPRTGGPAGRDGAEPVNRLRAAVTNLLGRRPRVTEVGQSSMEYTNQDNIGTETGTAPESPDGTLFTYGDPIVDRAAPDGPIETRWQRRRFAAKLVNPANRRRLTVIVVGTGLAGASAGATLAELGYRVKSYCYQDSPRRAHSIAAQGGINAAKNYRNDGDSIQRLFYDTVKGGDFRSRESNVRRLAEISVEIIDQAVAQGVPFAREYGGLLDTRSFGGAQVQRTFYARGQTGQQLLLGAYQALERQIGLGRVEMHSRHEMLELIVVDGRARGIVVRDLVTGEISTEYADAVVLATGGYGNVFYLSTNAKGCNVTATWRAHRKGAYFANPCFTQIHPTCIPVSGEHQSKLTLMSESLRNDGRVWVPKAVGDNRPPREIPEDERDYYLERMYPSYGNLVPRDIASRAAKNVCDSGRGVGPTGLGVYLDFADAIARLGRHTIADRYGNLFEMYQRITGEDPYEVPMRIYPAVHYTMGGLWVDYDLQSTIPGLFVIGEANFSDHGANRLGASALMQGLADGYFVLPTTIANYLAAGPFEKLTDDHPEVVAARADVEDRLRRLLAVKGDRTVDSFHRELGQIMWDHCGMERSDAGLRKALAEVRALRDQFWQRVRVPGDGEGLNQALEKAGRVADFFELAELMCIDALHRTESCGGHFRVESQTPDGEAQRDDEHFAYVAAWEFTGADRPPVLHKEDLHFEYVHPTQRSYK